MAYGMAWRGIVISGRGGNVTAASSVALRTAFRAAASSRLITRAKQASLAHLGIGISGVAKHGKWQQAAHQ